MGLIAELFLPSFTIEYKVYVTVAILGIIFAAFSVHKRTLELIPTDSKMRIKRKPSLNIRLTEGNAYSYEFDNYKIELFGNLNKDKEKKSIYAIPDSILWANIRINNDGTIPIEILSVSGSFNYPEKDKVRPLSFMVPDVKIQSESIKSYPVAINPGDQQFFTLEESIFTDNVTPAQFAARISRLLKNPDAHLTLTISVDALYGDHISKGFRNKFPIHIRPLLDLYINYWKKLNLVDLLRLSIQKDIFSENENSEDNDLPDKPDQPTENTEAEG